jgi:hypothetical protein
MDADFRRRPAGALHSGKERWMEIRTRMSMSADGFVTTPDGWPAQLADPTFASGESHGIGEFLDGCEAALMGHTTFAPALGADRWPWPNLDVFVLGSHVETDGAPVSVATDNDPARLLEQILQRAGQRTGVLASGRCRASALRSADPGRLVLARGARPATPGSPDSPRACARRRRRSRRRRTRRSRHAQRRPGS